MPLPWLVTMTVTFVSSMVGLGWMAANQSNKLSQVIDSQTQIVRKQDDIAGKYDDMRERITRVETGQQLQSLRITTLEQVKK